MHSAVMSASGALPLALLLEQFRASCCLLAGAANMEDKPELCCCKGQGSMFSLSSWLFFGGAGCAGNNASSFFCEQHSMLLVLRRRCQTERTMSKCREFVANSPADLEGDAATAYVLVLITMDSLNPQENITRRKAVASYAYGEQTHRKRSTLQSG